MFRGSAGRLLLLLAATVFASAALPAAVQAATVSVSGDDVNVVDTAGVPDRLAITAGASGGSTAFVIKTTDGRALTAGPGCTQTNTTTVTCQNPGEMSVRLGGGADTVTDSSQMLGVIEGEAGNDLIIDLNRATSPGTTGTFSGGTGTDTVSYFGRAEAVTAKLDDLSGDGAPGENDNVRSDVENLLGGNGNDSLTGSGIGNRLIGSPGNDTLNGLDANDVLLGGLGNDTELGGAGDDTLGGNSSSSAASDDAGVDVFKGDGGADQIFANDGVTDAVTNPGAQEKPAIDCGSNASGTSDLATVDLVDGDPVDIQNDGGCEAVQQAAKDQHPTVQVRGRVVRVRRGRAAVRLRCPRRAPGGRCVGTIRIVKRGATLGRGRYRLRAGRNRTVRLRLRRRVRGRAVVRTRERDRRGRPETTITRVRLRA